MLIQKPIHKLIKEISDEMDLPMGLVSDIVSSEFEYVVKEMRSGEKGDPSTFKSILLKYFGTFYFSPGKYDAIQKSIKRRSEKHGKESDNNELVV